MVGAETGIFIADVTVRFVVTASAYKLNGAMAMRDKFGAWNATVRPACSKCLGQGARFRLGRGCRGNLLERGWIRSLIPQTNA